MITTTTTVAIMPKDNPELEEAGVDEGTVDDNDWVVVVELCELVEVDVEDETLDEEVLDVEEVVVDVVEVVWLVVWVVVELVVDVVVVEDVLVVVDVEVVVDVVLVVVVLEEYENVGVNTLMSEIYALLASVSWIWYRYPLE